ncbi:hypothetical protein BASA50_007674 [Batrachochytrium salamandrivorans]|uniref:Uncharacterized protein n=1 Tax=Batrachochytrium salamandrivorans TaxID=1357716 RepID=A0ABQ8F6G0_9FUNG|nr:hypothetical protein BASA50_007674 [Batrachochytrium salamandrivorans]
MKLISFAVISLLAVTVSAHLPTRPPASNYVLQNDQDAVEEKIQELTTAYQEQQEAILKIVGPEKVERKEIGSTPAMEDIDSGSEKDYATRVDKSNVEKKHDIAVEDWKKSYAIMIAKKEDLRKAEAKRDAIEIEIFTLRDNHELRTEHNNRNRRQIGLSPGSYYSKRILVKQSNEVCLNFDDLSAANGIIDEGVRKVAEVIMRKKEPKKLKFRDLWEKLMGSRNKLVREVKFTERYCVYTRKLQLEFDLEVVSSQVWEAVKSFWPGS